MANPNPATKFQPGVVTNPNGRPKKEFSLTEGMRAFLSEHDPLKKQQRKDLLVEQTYKQAMRGDIAAIKMIFNYLEGMPKGSDTNVNVGVQVNYNFTKEELLQGVHDLVFKHNKFTRDEAIEMLKEKELK